MFNRDEVETYGHPELDSGSRSLATMVNTGFFLDSGSASGMTETSIRTEI